MAEFSNAAVATLLDRYGALLELAGERSFRARAYHNAADAIRAEPTPLTDLAAAGRLREIPGIGEGIAQAIGSILASGRFGLLDELAERYPLSLLELTQLPGVGVKTASRLFQDLGVVDLATLEAAARKGRIRATKGMGPKLEATIVAGLEALRRRTGRVSIGSALPAAQRLLGDLQTVLPSARIAVAGSVRRLEATVGDIDLVVAAADPDRAIELAQALPAFAKAERRDDTLRGELPLGLAADLVFTEPDQFGTALVAATGNAAHLALLGTPLPVAADEAAVYAGCGKPWIPPELRQGTVEFARAAEIPGLVVIADIQGEFHCHSTWSDGGAKIEAMLAAAADRGYRELAITDHSQSLGVANGLSPERLRLQRAEIDRLDGTDGVRLFQGAEVEVSRDGRLDYANELLARLDVVVASLHSGLRQPQAQLTDRLLGVLANPNVDIIAHPSGRLIERREGGDFDWPRVYAAAAEAGTALEINADPARLDLDDHHAAAALAAGCLLTINCDAHQPDGFATMPYGIAIARRAWARPVDVLNCWPVAETEAWLRRRGQGQPLH
ncbi:MAG TPA: helix-hairpin-helix domain-containing protein [Thermomicrobiales bacterium]|nr:helix-hairpin-helix domain-containing protein [Thermomicrobiales bacterium]